MICVDASVGVKWVLSEPLSDRAEDLAEYAGLNNLPLIAPPIFPMEVGNVLRHKVRRFDISQSDADDRFEKFLSYSLSLKSVDHLHMQALRLCDQHGLPAIYNAYYVLLAQQFGCDLWTDDQRLLNALDGRLPFVRWIGDFR